MKTTLSFFFLNRVCSFSIMANELASQELKKKNLEVDPNIPIIQWIGNKRKEEKKLGIPLKIERKWGIGWVKIPLGSSCEVGAEGTRQNPDRGWSGCRENDEMQDDLVHVESHCKRGMTSMCPSRSKDTLREARLSLVDQMERRWRKTQRMGP